MARSLVVDSHHHFVDPSRAHYPWMTGPKAALRRRFMAEDLRPTLVENGVDKTILVQTRLPMNETWEFLDLVPTVEFLAGIIGWVDLASPTVGEDIRKLRGHPSGRFLVGVRHKLHDEPDPGWILRAEVQRGIAALLDAGLVFDFLVRPRELPGCLETARRFPGVQFVIEHIAKPDIAGREISDWSARMAPFADLPNVACKLSGMVTEADPTCWTPADMVPYVSRLLKWFGEDRLVFGSDWPVCLLAGSYAQVKAALETALGNISPTARSKIFGTNAVAVYGLQVD